MTPAARRGDDRWVERLKVYVFLTLYTIGLWGSAGSWLPAPLDDWHALPYRVLGPWWHRHVLTQFSHPEQAAFFQLTASCLLALVVPLLALRSLGIGAWAAGLWKPGGLGVLITVAGIVITLPAGFWLAAVTPEPWGSLPQEIFEFLSIVPEHFLIFGVFGVLLLPGHRLGWPSVRHLGAGTALFAIAGSGLVFWLIHVGTPHPAELLMSLPLGLLFAGMTIVTGSIWPAIVAHVTLNVFPMALLTSG